MFLLFLPLLGTERANINLATHYSIVKSTTTRGGKERRKKIGKDNGEDIYIQTYCIQLIMFII
jgi:hypothetical protein